MTTSFLVYNLARWCLTKFGRHGRLQQDQVPKVQRFFEGISEKIIRHYRKHPRGDLRLYVLKYSHDCPGFPKGDLVVMLPINADGEVNLEVLVNFLEECPNKKLKEDTKELRETVKRLHRVWFDLEGVMQLTLASVRTQCLAYQISEHFCLPFDQWIYSQIWPESMPSTPPKKLKKVLKAEAMDGIDTKTISVHAKWDYGARKRLLTKYDAARKRGLVMVSPNTSISWLMQHGVEPSTGSMA
jgi:hypothetical protein